MKDYIGSWIHGEDTNPPKEQVSARVDVEISARIESLADFFGVKKSAIIEAALDIGTRDLEHQTERMTLNNDGKADYEDAKREHEENQ